MVKGFSLGPVTKLGLYFLMKATDHPNGSKVVKVLDGKILVLTLYPGILHEGLT